MCHSKKMMPHDAIQIKFYDLMGCEQMIDHYFWIMNYFFANIRFFFNTNTETT